MRVFLADAIAKRVDGMKHKVVMSAKWGTTIVVNRQKVRIRFRFAAKQVNALAIYLTDNGVFSERR